MGVNALMNRLRVIRAFGTEAPDKVRMTSASNVVRSVHKTSSLPEPLGLRAAWGKMGMSALTGVRICTKRRRDIY